MMTTKELLYLFNPWYRDQKYIPIEHSFPKRNLFSAFYKEITGIKQITSLTGLRRTGKSTLLKQTIASLLKSHTNPSYILYFSFDQPTIDEKPELLEEIIALFFSDIIHASAHAINKKTYLFFDEIQLIPFWQDIVKRYYDINPHLKFIVSGSSSLFISKKSKESLAGRIFTTTLSPLSFAEFRLFSGKSDFIDYLDFGQFPEMLELKDNTKKVEYLKEGVIGKVLEIDIVKAYGIRKTIDFERLFWSLLPNAGQIITSYKLMSDLSLKKATLFKYLSILEQSLLIQKVLNLSGSFRSEKRLLRKLYPASSNFLTLVPEPVSIGFRVETYVNTILDTNNRSIYLFHHRDKEIDFVLPDKQLAIEVKYQEHIHPSDYRFLEAYVKEKGYRGIVVTKSYEHKIPEKKLTFMTPEEFEEKISSF